MSLRYSVLGNLAVHDGTEERVIHGRKERLLLLDLLLHANRVVPVSQLLDDLWENEPSPRAADSLYVFVSHLRAVVGRATIRTEGGGYSLGVAPGALDADVFERLARDGRARLEEGLNREAADLLGEALALWRGPALGDLADHRFTQAAAARLDALRLSVLEDRLDAELELGRHARLIGELEGLVVEHPLRERLWGQLMRAHYAAGNQSDALEAYRRARAVLVEQGGLDPSASLQGLQQAILRQDPALERAAEPAAQAASSPFGARKLVTVVCARPNRRGEGHALTWFGLPSMREDDALRALRVAAEAAEHAVGVGVASAEVLVDASGAASGDVEAEAEALAASAAPGTVLVSALTERLTRGSAQLEPEPGTASFRLVRIEPPAARPEPPFVGRAHELATLRDAFAAVVRNHSAALVTVWGSAGLGKSRLAGELSGQLPEARFLHARCLPQRQGDAYAPIVELLDGLGPDAVARALEGRPDADAVAEALAAVRDVASLAPRNETRWALQRLLEALAVAEPIVVVLDDLHWANPLLLDILEDLPEPLRGSPVLLVCFARPDLLDTRPAWGGGRSSTSSLSLEPLAAEESGALVTALAAGISDGDRRAVVETAGGNPLFVEQLLALRAEGEALRLPAGILALLGARLDGLPSEELTLLQAASVIGLDFASSTLAALVPTSGDPDSALLTLARKELVRPAHEAPGLYRFRHYLIRDAAYATLPAGARADLHERVADLLERVGTGDGGHLVGYHVEQAYRCHVESGVPAADLGALATRGSVQLSAAAEHAVLKGDYATALELNERAADLRPALSRERGLLLLRSTITQLTDPGNERRLAEAAAIAAALGDDVLAAYARLCAAQYRLESDSAYSTEEYMREAAAARPALEAVPELASHALVMLGIGQLNEGQAAQADATLAIAARRARRRDVGIWSVAVRNRMAAWVWGPLRVGDARRRCERFLAGAPATPSRSRRLIGSAVRYVGACHAQAGDFAAAHRFLDQAEEIHQQLGIETSGANDGEIRMLSLYWAGDVAGAERAAAEVVRLALGASHIVATAASSHARLLCLLGRFDEAEETLALAVDAPVLALESATRIAVVGARLALARGDHEAAMERARSAVRLAGRTDCVNTIGDTHEDLAHVLDGVGEREAARAALEVARRTYARKGHVRARTLSRLLAADPAAPLA